MCQVSERVRRRSEVRPAGREMTLRAAVRSGPWSGDGDVWVCAAGIEGVAVPYSLELFEVFRNIKLTMSFCSHHIHTVNTFCLRSYHFSFSFAARLKAAVNSARPSAFAAALASSCALAFAKTSFT